MRRVIVQEWMTLDGVVQSPTGPEEDASGGFAQGGWHRPHLGDAVFMEWVTAAVQGASGYLYGRRTYEMFAAHWPNASAGEAALAEPLNARPKWVASRTLQAPLAWSNACLLDGDAADAVAALKRQGEGNLLVVGSTALVKMLLAHGLVDELRLMIDPVCVGGGKRIFEDDGALRRFRLADSRTTPSGGLLVTYTPQEAAP